MTHVVRNFNALVQAQADKGRFVCIGLDPDLDRVPECVRKDLVFDTICRFNQEIIDKTHHLVAAYKPNYAFYEGYGLQGLRALEITIEYIRTVNRDVAIILDAKRADIGNTNNGSRKMAFDWLMADAITGNPYLGAPAMEPFFRDPSKGVILLCRTSNPGAEKLQEAMVLATETDIAEFGTPKQLLYYQYVAYLAASRSTESGGFNANGNCAVVVGATFPEQMRHVRRIIGDDMLILAPGVGKQGGSVEATVRAARNSRGQGLLINSSSDILYASNGPDFGVAARAKAMALCLHVTQLLAYNF